MPYIGNSEMKSAAYAFERDLLLAGLSYAEIAQQTGERQMTISERNRLIHKVNIWDAFAARCEREGIPNRMPTDDRFCAWFTGFFDGEGSIIAFTRPSTGRPQYSEFRLGVRIQIRNDDSSTIHYLHDNIGCGRIARHQGRGNTSDSISWACEKISDLGQVIVPILDTFPLRTKKAREYILWRPLVIRRYIDTLGGYSNRNGIKEDYKRSFDDAIKAIGHIRRST